MKIKELHLISSHPTLDVPGKEIVLENSRRQEFIHLLCKKRKKIQKV
jgi:hypothetical protein